MAREFELDTRKDVVIRPPAARVFPGALPVGAATPAQGKPPWEDLYKDVERERRALNREKRELVDFASQMCSLTLGLAKMLIDARHTKATEDTVTIPKFLHEQMIGASVTVGEDKDGNPFVQVRERGKQRISPAD